MTPMRWPIPEGTPVVLCRACSAQIAFVITISGAHMPVNVGGEHEGETHFAHCNDPKRFRKRDKKKE